MADEPAELVDRGYTRGTAIAVVVIVGLWHSGNDLFTTLANWSSYRWPYLVAGCWLVFAALIVVCAWYLLRRDARIPLRWLVLGILLADSLAVDLCNPGQVLVQSNWAWGAVGWLVLIVYWRRPIRGMAGFLALNAAMTLAVLVPDGEFGRVGVSRWMMIVVGTGALQLGLSGAVRALRTAAGWAARASAAQAATVTRRAAADELHLARRQRYEVLRQGAADVLAELGYGADPTNLRMQHRCAAEAARLRRLVVETDDISDPLTHELRACADIAERKGVIVDLATAGRVPALPVQVRRALTEAPIAVLAAARSEARITVTVGGGLVAVGVVADTQLEFDAIPEAGAVAPADGAAEVESFRDGDRLWVQASVRIDPDPSPAAAA
ncbi:hypothetical protein GCM10023322_72400 [Rugosimonospora acidiphila]|uniref:Signal transduction histidine kinase n=1 Tax=Rugosimonospora acidiphila TaxID=556531 RepID=A0ABP9SNH4_9ACTN